MSAPTASFSIASEKIEKAQKTRDQREAAIAQIIEDLNLPADTSPEDAINALEESTRLEAIEANQLPNDTTYKNVQHFLKHGLLPQATNVTATPNSPQ